MSDNLNLLKNRSKDYGHGSLVHFFKIISYICLTVVLVSSILLFFLKVSSEIPSLKKQEAAVSSSLSLMANRIVKFVMLKDRLKEADNVLEKRSKFANILEIVDKNRPEGFTVDSFSLDKSSLVMNLTSSSLSQLDIFLTDLEKEKIFKKITLENLALDENNASFKLSLKINL